MHRSKCTPSSGCTCRTSTCTCVRHVEVAVPCVSSGADSVCVVEWTWRFMHDEIAISSVSRCKNTYIIFVCFHFEKESLRRQQSRCKLEMCEWGGGRKYTVGYLLCLWNCKYHPPSKIIIRLLNYRRGQDDRWTSFNGIEDRSAEGRHLLRAYVARFEYERSEWCVEGKEDLAAFVDPDRYISLYVRAHHLN